MSLSPLNYSFFLSFYLLLANLPLDFLYYLWILIGSKPNTSFCWIFGRIFGRIIGLHRNRIFFEVFKSVISQERQELLKWYHCHMTSQTQSNIHVTLLLLFLFCPVSEVVPSWAENNRQLGNTFFITSMYLGFGRSWNIRFWSITNPDHVISCLFSSTFFFFFLLHFIAVYIAFYILYSIL
jgi:hypothetical protein